LGFKCQSDLSPPGKSNLDFVSGNKKKYFTVFLSELENRKTIFGVEA